MKRNLTFTTSCFLFLLTVALAPFSAMAKEVTIGKLKYKVNTTDKIAKCTGLATEATKNYNLTIPSTVTYNNVTLKVTTVESEAFSGDDYLKKVTLSDYTETIGSYAFYCCENISIVSLGKKLKIIGKEAFSHCGNSGTFKTVTFPSTLEIIRENAFLDCRSLATINFNDNLKTIEATAFWNCEALTSILLPGSLESIGESAFACCDGLKEVTFKDGKGKTVIGTKCFDNLKNLQFLNFYGPGVAKISNSAFIGCGIEWLVLPTSVEVIGEAAFSGNRLSKLILPEGLKTIERLAFCDQYYYGLSEITIPSTVTSIGNDAFDDCGELTKVTSLAVNPPAMGTNSFENWTTSHAKLYVPSASVAKYKAAAIWKDFRYINDEDTSNAGVGEVMADEVTDETWYDLMGNVVDAGDLLPGVYIVRRGGVCEKVHVK